LGSAIFLGIMSSYENKYLAVSPNKIDAAFHGFNYSLKFAGIIFIIGFIISLTLKYNTKKDS
jgi:DHA2 family lincomycin resistance protein-like MFS transporter